MPAFYIAFLNNIKNNIKPKSQKAKKPKSQKAKKPKSQKAKSYSTVTTLAKFLGLSGLMPFPIEII